MVYTNGSEIRIALAGHTGAGKTSLIANLRKAPSGDIGKSGNTTRWAEEFSPPEYHSLHAVFIDCPGFQIASKMFEYIDEIKNVKSTEKKIIANQFLEKSRKRGMNVEYDIKAVDKLETSDVVLYVANTLLPPEDGNVVELKVIQELNRPIIVILNKYLCYEHNHNRDDKVERINLWKEKLVRDADISLGNMIEYDTHWDHPSKIESIYDTVFKVLPKDKKERFKEGLDNFKEREKELKEEAFILLYEELSSIKYQKLRNRTESEIKTDLINKLSLTVENFIKKVNELYKINVENPKMSVDNLVKNTRKKRESPTVAQRIKDASSTGSVGGVIGSAGILASFIFVSVLTGGTATLTMGLLSGGAFVGSTVGAVMGATSSKGDSFYEIDININKDIQEYFSEICITVIFVLSHYGYSAFFTSEELERTKTIPQGMINTFIEKVQQFNKNENEINWSRVEKKEVINWCKRVIDKLEKI